MAWKHHYDPLLESLVLFAKLYHRPVSVDALISGLPTRPGETGPELFSISHGKGLFSLRYTPAGFHFSCVGKKGETVHFPSLLEVAVR